MKIALFLAWIVWESFCPSDAFIPTKLLAWSVSTLDLSLNSVVTHRDMTRKAILEVAANLLKDNLHPRRKGSSSQVKYPKDLDEEGLIATYYGMNKQSRKKTLQGVIEDISDANAGVDLGRESSKDTAAHFDSEQFLAGQSRLVTKRRNVVTQILLSKFEIARKECGRMLHTIQDFYSHSNWVENGNSDPYHVLGKEGEKPGQIADSIMQTCTDCETGRTAYSIGILNTVSMIFKPYSCKDNIVKGLQQSGMLTSGYADQRTVRGRLIKKPFGKCSHGGFMDETSSVHAKGGINKDSPFEVWSPHYYLYEEAVRLAKQATINILQEIRSDVNNDELFGFFLGLPLGQKSEEVISITYVIDISRKMKDELHEIQATIPVIRRNLKDYANDFGCSMKVRYILVPFNNKGTY